MALDASEYQIDISGDKMEACFEFTGPAAPQGLTAADILAALAAKGVTQGIDEMLVQRIAKTPIVKMRYSVAKGKSPQDGQPEYIEYKFDASSGTLPDEQEDTSIDFRSIKNYNSTRAQTIIAIKHPATAGTPGYDVLGNEFKPREGKKTTIRAGKGVVLSEDGNAAIADIDGHACLMGDRVTVLGTVEIPANVDYSVGNISFIGNIRVRGGVMPGFTVIVEGDLEIAGNVEKATLQCGGNLNVHGIVFGQGACEIEVAGDANIGAVDQAKLTIRGDLNVVNYIRHCHVAVGGQIKLSGKKGTIVGGELAAFRGITSPYIGNNMATLTKLMVGSNPFISSELTTVNTQLDDLNNKMAQVNTAIETIYERRARYPQTEAATQPILERLLASKRALEPEIHTLTEQQTQLQEQSTDNKDAKIRISDIVYPGVVINFRDRLQYKTMDEAQHLCFYEEAAEIRTGPF